MRTRHIRPALTLAGAAALGLLLLPGAAEAQDAADFAQKFTAAYAYSGYEITLGAGTGADGTITYDGVSIAMPELGLADPMTLAGPVVFSGVVAAADGGYTADRLSLPPLALDFDGIAVSLADIAFTRIVVPAGPDISVDDAVALIGGASTGRGAVSLDGKDVVSITGTQAGVTRSTGTDGKPVLETSSTVSGLSIDLGGIDIPELQAGLAAAGMATLTGSLHQHATWSTETGAMDIDETSITLDGLGKISFSLNMLGYTAELIEAAAAGRDKLKALTDPDERAAAQLALAETLLDGIALGGAGVRYEDLGLVPRLIDFTAEAQGASRDEIVDGLAVALPAMLMGGGDLAATARSAEAASAFLADPKSLEIAIAFKEPLSFAGLDLEDPDATPEMPDGMSISFSANGIGPIPMNLDGIDIEALLGGLEAADSEPQDTPELPSGAGSRALPPPGRDPRLD